MNEHTDPKHYPSPETHQQTERSSGSHRGDFDFVGGQPIVPVAQLEGESIETNRHKAFLAALDRAWHAEQPDQDKQKNMQAIIDAAKAAGVPVPVLVAKLEGYKVTILRKKQDESRTTAARNLGDVSTQVDQEQGKALTELEVSQMVNEAARELKEANRREMGRGMFSSVPDEDLEVDLMIARSRLPDNLGRRFDAHGISKGTTEQQFRTLLSILQHGIRQDTTFHSVDLYRDDENDLAAATGAAGPYSDGGFILIGSPRASVDAVGTNLIAETGVAGVIVNTQWYGAIDRLRTSFPHVHFIKAEDMEHDLTEWINEVYRQPE